MLDSMARTGADAVWSMGDDTPIPPLSRMPQPLYAFFRQRFAQVTNPPLDPIREAVVMSLRMQLGRQGSFLRGTSAAGPPAPDRPSGPGRGGDGCAALAARVRQRDHLGDTWPAAERTGGPPGGARPAAACEADRAARQGARLLILSDRAADRDNAPDPDAAGRRRGAPAPARQGAPAPARPGGRGGRRLGCASRRDPVRVRRRGDPPVARPGDGRRPRDRANADEARQSYRTVAREGPPQDHVEDGHRGAAELLRRPDLRGPRPRRRGDRLRLPRHPVAPRRTGSRGDRRGCAGPPRGGLERHESEALPDYGRLRFRKDAEHHGWAPQTVECAAEGDGERKRRRTRRTGTDKADEVQGVRRQGDRRAAGGSTGPAPVQGDDPGLARHRRTGRRDPCAGSFPRRCRSAHCRRRRTRHSRSR